MAYIPRLIEDVVEEYLGVFPLTGPRQSGKSTMLMHLLLKYRYVSFDDPLLVERVSSDPRGLLQEYANRVIFDEVMESAGVFPLFKNSDRFRSGSVWQVCSHGI